MKIKKVSVNDKKRCFVVETSKEVLEFPYSRVHLKSSLQDKIKHIFVDQELGREAFTYQLESGKENTVHLDQVLEYNQDVDYLRKMLLYKLTLKAQALLKERKSPKREVMRRMGTSPTQFYRLIDQTNYKKTIDQMTKLLTALDCHV